MKTCILVELSKVMYKGYGSLSLVTNLFTFFYCLSCDNLEAWWSHRVEVDASLNNSIRVMVEQVQVGRKCQAVFRGRGRKREPEELIFCNANHRTLGHLGSLFRKTALVFTVNQAQSNRDLSRPG